nr:tetratricopeptide repeat protein [Pseudenhygromyxa sp. WMMC2535]
MSRGTQIGRYVILDKLGSGAMGVVYSAYDPELDRKLALKLLHPGTDRSTEATRRRLRREAQALARVSHPNVVGVHDVGTHRGRVFVAMEFVAGHTLRAWLAADGKRPRPVEDIIEVFLEAGRGLAAAHEAGLIHRDFKPENVLLDHLGHARVVDFGLVRRAGEELLTDDSAEEPTLPPPPEPRHGYARDPSEEFLDPDKRSLEISLTLTGRAMGTPAYMSPEQHLGQTATARSDQFAFCIALWEALYGERPFPGNDYQSLSRAVIDGRINEPPDTGPYANRHVPGHVHRVLLRGLSASPGERFPNITALLTALGQDAGRRRRRDIGFWSANLLGGALLFAAGVFVADRLEPDAPSAGPRCEAAAELDPIWNAEAREAITKRFFASELPYADFTSRELGRRLDAYADQWIDAREALCETTQLQGESPALLAQRACLDERRRELATYTATLLEADPERFASMAEHALAAAEALPSVAACRDPERLRSPLGEPEQRERVEQLEQRLAEAATLAQLGEPAAGLERVREVAEEAGALGSRRTQVRALIALADLEEKLGESDAAVGELELAYALTEREGEDWLRAQVAIELIALLGATLERPPDARHWQEIADPLLERIGDPMDLRGKWWFQVGRVHARASEFSAAERALSQAVAVLEQAHGPDSAQVDPVLQALGAVARDRGDYQRAIDFHERVLDRRRAAYGPDHPQVAAIYGSLGHDAYERGDYEQARAYYDKALRIIGECYGEDSPAYASRLNNYAAVLERLGQLDQAEDIHRQLLTARERRYGSDDVRVTTSLENLGLVLLSAGRFTEAAEQFERSLALRRKHYGPEHVATATSQLNLGYALARLDERTRARALYQAALSTWTRKLGERHPDLALIHDNLGELDLREGKLAAAREHYTLALSLIEATLGEDAADLGYSLTGLAEVALAEGDFGVAITRCERALEVRQKSWLPPGDLGQTQLTLSRALAKRDQPGDHSRARDLARLAVDDIERSRDQQRVEAARSWLDSL